jgi:GH25 family lysozyme M1 (1,4-beta-N-acetylmuramidase)
MVRGKHALKPDRSAQMRKAGAVLTALAASGTMVAQATGVVEASNPAPIAQKAQPKAHPVSTAVGENASQTTIPDSPISARNAQKFQQQAAQPGYYAENPAAELPSSISSSLPSDAQVVGTHYAQTPDGTLYNVENGQRVTDPAIVGTPDRPADPLAKSDGVRFIPVPIQTARQEIEAYQRSQSHTENIGHTGQVRTSAEVVSSPEQADGVVRGRIRTDILRGARLSDSPAVRHNMTRAVSTNFSGYYGAHWGSVGSEPVFMNSRNQAVIRQARRVVDVSEWQSNVDWARARSAGVQAAIIRTNYGRVYRDKKVARNIAECKRLGIPFGIYMYSTARNANQARQEADFTVQILQENGVRSSTLALPIYLDLENFQDHPGTSGYVEIVDAWLAQMRSHGYTNTGVYSYTSYLDTTLNDPSILSHVSWVAQYAGGLQYTQFSSNFRGWQYSDKGSIDGFPTHSVDLDAFGYGSAVNNGQQPSEPVQPSHPSQPTQPSRPAQPERPSKPSRPLLQASSFPLASIPNGDYYLDSYQSDSASVEIPGANKASGTTVRTYRGNGTPAQRFTFTRHADGTYTIVNMNSHKALDVPSARAYNGQRIQQYSSNNSRAQRWYVRQAGGGAVFIQSALGNYILDLTGRSTSNGTVVQLWNPGVGANQKFMLTSVPAVRNVPTDTSVKIESTINPDQVADIPSASKANGTPVQLYQSNGTTAQRYQIEAVGNGVYRMYDCNSGKAIDVRNGGTVNGTAIQQYSPNGTQSQNWYVRGNGNGTVGFYNRNSGRYIDVPSGKAHNGAKLQLYNGNATRAQRFRIVQAASTREMSDRLAAKNRSVLKDGTYRLAAARNQSYALTATNSNAQLGRQDGTESQLWNVTHDDAGYVTFTNVKTGKVLDLSAARAEQGRNIDMWAANNTWAQRWIVERSGAGLTLHSAVDPGYALDIASDRMANGTNVRAWKLNDSDGQRLIAQPPAIGAQAADLLADAHRNDLSNGSHRLFSASNHQFALDLASASTADGANVRIYRSNGTAAQLWAVSHDRKGYVILTNVASGKVLDLDSARAVNGQNVRQYSSNGTRAQRWIAVCSGNSFVLHSAVNPDFVIDIDSNRMANGTNVRLWRQNHTTAQSWIG